MRGKRCEAFSSSTGKRCNCRIAAENVASQRFEGHTLLCDNHWKVINRGRPVSTFHAALTRIDGADKTTDHPGARLISDVCLRATIVAALSPDLLRPEYRGSANALTGHCYIATEAYCHLTGAKPHFIRHEGAPHWYAVLDGAVVDLTAGQFATPPDYSKGRGKGLLTREPSKRARVLMARVREVNRESSDSGIHSRIPLI